VEDVRYRKVSFVIEVGGDERNRRRKKSLHKYVGIARPSNTTTFGHGPMGTTAGQRGRKLEEETETFRVQKVSLSVSQRIQQGRMEKGLKQKELARLINTKPTTIQSYENGKAVPSGRVIQQIERALGMQYGAISGKKRKGKGKKK